VFHHYRQLIALRKQYPVLVHGRYELLLPDHPHVFAYLRDDGVRRVLVLCNFSGQHQDLSLCDLPDMTGAQWLIGNVSQHEAQANATQLAKWQGHAWIQLHAGN
jgi:oligo-1,6-glucosidase